MTASDSPLRFELLELGFPEDVLSQLDDSELARFEGAYGAKKRAAATAGTDPQTGC